MRHMQLTIRLLCETDGGWIGGVWRDSRGTARKVKSLALRAIAAEIEHGEMPPAAGMLQFSTAR